eukprot:TRINITY_DN5466_c0_g3_i1.p1 TRINITY_DN5466_c0_g3~~TRINITY_DN5466_c0_g3_i1.p1  ORF type:complete len:296 (-),score=39.48 TRINITY_DN5466_c0_g3_i1:117-881(-)
MTKLSSDRRYIRNVQRVLSYVRRTCQEIVSPALLRTTVLMTLIWLSAAFTYYGAVLIPPELFREESLGIRCPNYHLNQTSSASSTSSSNMCEGMLTTSDFKDMLLASMSELPSVLGTIFVIERFGRKSLIGSCYLLGAFSFCALVLCWSRGFETFLMFCGRGVITAGFQALYVYTPEVYPTTVRASALGIFASLSRVGAFLSPFVAQVLAAQVSDMVALLLYAVASVIAAVSTFALPIETRGRPMLDLTTTKDT